MENMLPARDNGPDGAQGLRKQLDEAVVLRATVEQLRKDLRADDIGLPAVGQGAFEELRAQVAAVVACRERAGAHALGLLVNRVDLTEAQVHQAMAAEGGHGLAGAMVLRCLQKVLSRLRHAGLA